MDGMERMRISRLITCRPAGRAFTRRSFGTGHYQADHAEGLSAVRSNDGDQYLKAGTNVAAGTSRFAENCRRCVDGSEQKRKAAR
jgi:hypothetical protein